MRKSFWKWAERIDASYSIIKALVMSVSELFLAWAADRPPSLMSALVLFLFALVVMIAWGARKSSKDFAEPSPPAQAEGKLNLLIVISLLTMGIVSLAAFFPEIFDREIITKHNAEQRIRRLADAYSLPIQAVEDQRALFTFIVTVPTQKHITISQAKHRDNYLSLQAGLATTDRQRSLLEALPPPQARALLRKLRIALAQQRVTFSDVDMPLNRVRISKDVAIANGIRQDDLVRALNDISGALVISMETMLAEFQEDVGARVE